MSPLANVVTILALATLGAALPSPASDGTVSGNAWELACGSSCSDVATIASGDWTTGTQTCYNFDSSYSSCWLNITQNLVSYGEVYGWFSEGSDCVATAAEEGTFETGVCADISGASSYIVVFEI